MSRAIGEAATGKRFEQAIERGAPGLAGKAEPFHPFPGLLFKAGVYLSARTRCVRRGGGCTFLWKGCGNAIERGTEAFPREQPLVHAGDSQVREGGVFQRSFLVFG